MNNLKEFTIDEIERLNVTKQRLAELIGLKENGYFDYALPQEWLNAFIKAKTPDFYDESQFYTLVRSTTFSVYIDGELNFISGCKEVNYLIKRYLKE